MRRTSYNTILSILIVLLNLSCGSDQSVDVSQTQVSFDTEDFYLDFWDFDTTDCRSEVQGYLREYPKFFNFYLDTLMNIGGVEELDGDLCTRISFLINNKDLKFLADTIRLVYPNTEKQKEQIDDLYRHITYYLPQWKAPDVVFFDGGLRLWSVVMYQDYIAVGLDMFLGKDFQYYASRQIPRYMEYSLESSQIPVQVAKVIYDDIYPSDVRMAVDFLEMMILSGKRMLFLEYVLPEMKGADYFALSPEKYQWLEDNEGEIYNYFIRKEMIYSSDLKDNLKYIQDAPFSAGMPTESPGRTGVYIGYKIMQAYIEKTQVGLVEAIQKENYKEIFEKSKYKPF